MPRKQPSVRCAIKRNANVKRILWTKKRNSVEIPLEEQESAQMSWWSVPYPALRTGVDPGLTSGASPPRSRISTPKCGRKVVSHMFDEMTRAGPWT